MLFVTPEYNRSIPGALKNAIDWASRPYGTNSFARKPSAVIGTSPGAIGTAVAQQNLRSVLGFCDLPQMNAPEAYIQFTPGLITDDGEVTNDETANFLRNTCQEFHIFIARVLLGATEGRLIVIHAIHCGRRASWMLHDGTTMNLQEPSRQALEVMSDSAASFAFRNRSRSARMRFGCVFPSPTCLVLRGGSCKKVMLTGAKVS